MMLEVRNRKNLGRGATIERVRRRVLPNLRYLPSSSFRRCGCCEQPTLFVALGSGDEFRLCVRCRANLRYELLARYLRATVPDWSRLNVVELDPDSPLRNLLSQAGNYTRTFYVADRGASAPDGVQWQDIMALTFDDDSVDLLVSSDVLEHVPDLSRAFAESCRVLKPGGRHVFTVPPKARTVRRAELRDGKTIHHSEPEFHRDPTADGPILVYWEIGIEDAPQILDTAGMRLEIVIPPTGRDGRVVWCASKPE
jgi:SAM-dependent methyltransferase